MLLPDDALVPVPGVIVSELSCVGKAVQHDDCCICHALHVIFLEHTNFQNVQRKVSGKVDFLRFQCWVRYVAKSNQ